MFEGTPKEAVLLFQNLLQRFNYKEKIGTWEIRGDISLMEYRVLQTAQHLLRLYSEEQLIRRQ